MLKVVYRKQNRIPILLLLFAQPILILFLFFTSEVVAQNELSDSKNIETNEEGMAQNPGISLEEIKEYAEVINVFLEIIIIVLLAKTVRDFSELAKVSKLQTRVLFRPWIGPHGGIEFIESNNDSQRYAIKLKNFGEIPASNVTAFSRISDNVPKRDEVIKLKKINFLDNDRQKYEIDKFTIGPLLPGMEKRYWIFIRDETIKRAKEGTSNIYILFYFSYDFSGERSGYGMISQFDKNTNTFVHNEMWID